MKKISTLVLSLVMVFTMLLSLSGCASEQSKFIGTWKTEIDMDDIMMAQIEGEEGIGDYYKFDGLTLTVEVTFTEDGAYKKVVTEESEEKFANTILDVMLDGTLEMLVDAVAEQGVEMSIDDILEAQGTTKDALRESMAEELDVESMVADFEGEGKYQVEEGKLYTSYGDITVEKAVEDGKYETYEIDGETLKLLESVGQEKTYFEDQELTDEALEKVQEEVAKVLYPRTYTKVK